MGEYICHVRYYEKRADKMIRHESPACFYSLPYEQGNLPQDIRYIAEVDEDLSDDSVKFYCQFLEKILDGERFTYRLRKIGGERYVRWKMKTEGLNRAGILLYLTAQRICQEYPEILIELFNRKDNHNTIEKLFKEFQKIHFEAVKGDIELTKYGNMSGHSLIYNYAWGGNAKFSHIKIKQLKERLAAKKYTNVHAYFSGGKEVKIKIPKKKQLKRVKFENIWPEENIEKHIDNIKQIF